ncbi:MAG: tyrosine-type recombinase/integrase, partial [Actinomycetota bacterium]|nr:tyrosine-type recombinase/integrase [Actinomycetota bacterium]
MATSNGGRLTQGNLWELGPATGRSGRIVFWEQLSPHSLRHTATAAALDAGVGMCDVQDYVRHRDPRTTRRYDHSRHNLDRLRATPSPSTSRSSG